MYSYNSSKMSIIFLDDKQKKVKEVLLKPLINVYYDKKTSDEIKRQNRLKKWERNGVKI